ncbi:MAG: arginine--tRNA ligase, partial [Deltaproteobacteria bacterium]|nr:arginine--tRNA ligase [Deltaproteobacteria bacterium]
KLRRGFDKVIDIWGADHHGYQGRIRALFKAFGEDDKRLDIIFIQLVSLLRNGEPVSMSTRGGEFVTLKEVVDEVGKDACRFTFMMRRSDAQLDFDLELVKIQAPENPVYYVQYCHARIMSILTLAKEKGFELSDNADESIVERLKESDEIKLIKKLAAFEEVVEKSAIEMEPHRIAFYLQELAAIFHSFYGRNRVVLDDDKDLTLARMGLSKAVSVVIKNGLAMLGVSAPDKM